VTETSAPTPPAGRYGPEPTDRSRRLRLAGLVVVVLAAVAVIAWLGIGTLRDPVQWKDIGYRVDGATSVDVTFDVTKAPAATVTCRVQALSQSYAQVGLRSVDVGPGDTATQRVTVTVPTAEPAVTGTVETCHLADAG